MLSRLTDHFNDAQNLLKKLRINQRILELESVSPTGLELANEVQTTTNNLSAKYFESFYINSYISN